MNEANISIASMAKAKLSLNHTSISEDSNVQYFIDDLLRDRISLLGDKTNTTDDKFSKKKYTITKVGKNPDEQFTLTLKGSFNKDENQVLKGSVKGIKYTYKEGGLTSSMNVSGISQELKVGNSLLGSESTFEGNDKFIIKSNMPSHKGVKVLRNDLSDILQFMGQGDDDIIIKGGGVFKIYPGDLLTPGYGSKKITIAARKGNIPKIQLQHSTLAVGDCSKLDATIVLKGIKDYENTFGANLANKTTLISESISSDHYIFDSWCSLDTFNIIN